MDRHTKHIGDFSECELRDYIEQNLALGWQIDVFKQSGGFKLVHFASKDDIDFYPDRYVALQVLLEAEAWLEKYWERMNW